MGCLEVIDQKDWCHRGPFGLGLRHERGQFGKDIVGIDSRGIAGSTQPLPPATAVVELVAFEHPRRGGLGGHDLGECWIIGHGA